MMRARNTSCTVLKIIVVLTILNLSAAASHAASSGSVGASAKKRVAVVELRNSAGLRDEEAAYLAGQVREHASMSLSGERFLIMTLDNIVALLPPGKTLADCAKVQCEVEVGRTIGADYIVTGEVLRFGQELRMSLAVHQCASGAFLGSATIRGGHLNDIEGNLVEAAGKVTDLIQIDAMPASAIDSLRTTTVAGERTQSQGRWSPKSRKLVVARFDSDPAGAVVLINGELACQSTPCSKALPVGPVTLTIQKERYLPFSEKVVLYESESGINLRRKLVPDFGYLDCQTVPEGIAVSVDGRAVGVTPLNGIELSPGIHEVRLGNTSYYEQVEQVGIQRGAVQQLKRTLVPRIGALEVEAFDEDGNSISAALEVDGVELGGVPGTHAVVVGEHRIAVRAGRGKWEGRVVIREQETHAVRARIALRKVRDPYSGNWYAFKTRLASALGPASYDGHYVGGFLQSWSPPVDDALDFGASDHSVYGALHSPRLLGAQYLYCEANENGQISLEQMHCEFSGQYDDLSGSLRAISHEMSTYLLTCTYLRMTGPGSPVRLGIGGGGGIGYVWDRYRIDGGYSAGAGTRSGGMWELHVQLTGQIKAGKAGLLIGEIGQRLARANLTDDGYSLSDVDFDASGPFVRCGFMFFAAALN